MKKADAYCMLTRQDASSVQKDRNVSAFGAPPLEVLVVEDLAEQREYVARILYSAGYRVQIARGGNVARTLLGDHPPALVITDLQMPDGDGWDLLFYCQQRWPLLP